MVRWVISSLAPPAHLAPLWPHTLHSSHDGPCSDPPAIGPLHMLFSSLGTPLFDFLLTFKSMLMAFQPGKTPLLRALQLLSDAWINVWLPHWNVKCMEAGFLTLLSTMLGTHTCLMHTFMKGHSTSQTISVESVLRDSRRLECTGHLMCLPLSHVISWGQEHDVSTRPPTPQSMKLSPLEVLHELCSTTEGAAVTVQESHTSRHSTRVQCPMGGGSPSSRSGPLRLLGSSCPTFSENENPN